ncbi:MarR family transcriptional regulator [Paenarthrobacter sp. PH39-S1]|uniref:MarR family winged helix-turn-helix transcriptional regulator n=1 Tax=Paenarthrobacter sp. PH39-S1 TaxID=3046204 RepID=UPI0024BA2509|nr:MarR family transcriptional regulator [Paenarthrobacter sp. PH39-S1]MDJ0356614.1 MarR family transcriptional regulator [Paenarthrobacter sp. PH39-S1]
MENTQIREHVGQSVLRFIAAVVLHNQAVSSRVGLGASDGQVLSLLNVDGPKSPGQLAAITGLSTGSMTALLDRLERGGFIKRERDPHDRRKVLVVPAAEGQARLAHHYTEYGAHLQAVLSARSPEQLEIIADFLDDMTDVDGGYVSRSPTDDIG